MDLVASREKLIVHDNVNTEIVSPGIHKVTSMLANKGINLADRNVNGDKLRNVQLLIGVDYFNQIVISQKKVFGVNSFVTPGGLIPFGPLPSWSRPAISYDESRLYCNCVLCEPPLESLWDLETIGISTERSTHDEKIAVSSVVSEMEHTAQGYVVTLPFKSDERPANNLRNVHVQLNSLVARCKKDVELFEQYNNVIDEYKEKKFIEEVYPTDYSGCFLPHHPVFKESATTPLRIVFNASSNSKGGGKSLNDCLYAGPSLTTKLHNLLLTLCSKSFAVISDISKAFHRVIVHPEYCKWTKFLWVNSEREAQLIYQFNVLIFGSRSSPFILSQVLETHTSSHAKPICNLASYFYVDNLVKTYEDESELISEKVVIDSVLEEANMPLRGWISNSQKFNSTYQVNEPSLQMVSGIS